MSDHRIICGPFAIDVVAKLVTKDGEGRISTRQILPVRFVPLTGDHPREDE